MSFSPEYCPICQYRLIQVVETAAKPCKRLDGLVISYVQSGCLKTPDSHTYYQISSLYGHLYLEEIYFKDTNRSISVNYTKSKTTITYCTNGQISEEKIEIPRILTLDYPKLEKIQEKMNILTPFL